MSCSGQVNLAALAAGTRFLVSYDCGTTFEEVPGITAVGDIGEQAETQETTTLADKSRTYISALSTPANKQFVGNLLASNIAQSKFCQAAKDKQTVMIKIVMPTKPKTIGVNEVVLLGFQVNGPTAENVIQFTANGQASGATIWSTDNDIDISSIKLSALTNTVKVDDTLKLTTEVIPSDATVSKDQLVYTSINPDIASVDKNGVVTGLAIGDYSVRCSDSLSNTSTLFFGRCVSNGKLQTINIALAAPDTELFNNDKIVLPVGFEKGRSVNIVTTPNDCVGVLSGNNLEWNGTDRTLKLTGTKVNGDSTITFSKDGYADKVVTITSA